MKESRKGLSLKAAILKIILQQRLQKEIGRKSAKVTGRSNLGIKARNVELIM